MEEVEPQEGSFFAEETSAKSLYGENLDPELEGLARELALELAAELNTGAPVPWKQFVDEYLEDAEPEARKLIGDRAFSWLQLAGIAENKTFRRKPVRGLGKCLVEVLDPPELV